MSRALGRRKKGVSLWIPLGFLLWIILMLTIFFAFVLAGPGRPAGLSFSDALLFVLLRMGFIALFFSPLLLAGVTIWLGYRFLIKKKLKTMTEATPESPS